MSIVSQIKNGILPIEISCHLAVINNIPKNYKIYQNSFDKIKEIVIENFGDYKFEEIDIKIEISQILETYNEYQ